MRRIKREILCMSLLRDSQLNDTEVEQIYKSIHVENISNYADTVAERKVDLKKVPLGFIKKWWTHA